MTTQTCTSCETDQYPDHSAQMSRLNRISGQISGVKKMIDERRYCPDILTQLRAVRSAVKSLEAEILETHLGACVVDAMQSQNQQEIDQKIAELTNLFRRYEG